jgi:hypothetical protein
MPVVGPQGRIAPRPNTASAVGNVTSGIGGIRSGVKAASTTRSDSRPSAPSQPRSNKTGTSSGGPSAGNPIANAPPGTGPAGVPIPLSQRSLAGAITQAQLQASLSPTQGNFFSIASGSDNRKRRRSYA